MDIIEVELNSNTKTTDLIDRLHEHRCNPRLSAITICLKNIYTIWRGIPMGHYPGTEGYAVSLLLECSSTSNDRIDSGKTFTWLKQETKKVVHVNENIDKKNVLLQTVLKEIIEMQTLNKKDELIIKFDKPVTINAQGKRDYYGRTGIHYIIGIKVWRYV